MSFVQVANLITASTAVQPVLKQLTTAWNMSRNRSKREVPEYDVITLLNTDIT